MAIYRGPGGAGDATADATNAASVAEDFADAAGVSAAAAAVSAANAATAETAAEAAQTAAEAAQAAAETAETNAETAETNAETALASVQSLVNSLNTADIAALAPISAEISAVALITSDISAIASLSTADFTALASVTADIQTLAPISADITAVASIDSDVTAVAALSTADIAAVASVSSDIQTLAPVAVEIGQIAALTTAQLATLSGAAPDMAILAPIASDISAVALIDTDVTAVAALSTADISTVATNVADITNFADVYLGPAASDPATRNDSSALQAGDLYFNTTDDAMKVYDGAAWVVAYVSGAGFLAASNNLSDLTNAATARQNLDLEIGVDVQAYDADTAKTDVAQTFSAKQTFAGAAAEMSVEFKNAIEDGTVSVTAATGTINFDVLTQSVLLYTSDATGNWTLNVRGSSGTTLSSLMDVGDSISIAFLVTNGATPYYQTAFQVDGSSVTPKWQGGTAPTAGNASSIDSYSIVIIKTAATPTYTALASVTKFA